MKQTQNRLNFTFSAGPKMIRSHWLGTLFLSVLTVAGCSHTAMTPNPGATSGSTSDQEVAQSQSSLPADRHPWFMIGYHGSIKTNPTDSPVSVKTSVVFDPRSSTPATTGGNTGPAGMRDDGFGQCPAFTHFHDHYKIGDPFGTTPGPNQMAHGRRWRWMENATTIKLMRQSSNAGSYRSLRFTLTQN